jgi:hypothetical protein
VQAGHGPVVQRRLGLPPPWSCPWRTPRRHCSS